MNVLTRQFFERLSLIFLLLLVLLFGGAKLFQYLEGWTLIQSFYFATATVTTVGYGDIVPTSDASRLVASIYALLSIPLMFFSIGIVGEVVFARYHDNMEARRRGGGKKKRRR